MPQNRRKVVLRDARDPFRTLFRRTKFAAPGVDVADLRRIDFQERIGRARQLVLLPYGQAQGPNFVPNCESIPTEIT